MSWKDTNTVLKTADDTANKVSMEQTDNMTHNTLVNVVIFTET